MNRRVSPALIGAFVVGAVALSVVAVIMFGSGRYFRKTHDFVLYFTSSVNGLHVGAPVKFRGVEVGAVKDIRLQLNLGDTVQRVPVIIEIDPGQITSRGGRTTVLTDPQAFQQTIDAGLRGQLQLESLLTGRLFVGFDFFPGSPATLYQVAGHRYPYRELPTQPTSLEEARGAASKVLAKLAETDFKAFVDSATRAVTGLNQLVSSPELKLALRSLDRGTSGLSDAAQDISRLAIALDTTIQGLSGDLRTTSAALRTTLQQAGDAISETQATVNDSPTLYELNRSLREVAAAARALRLFTGYLEGNPSALIFGKPATEK